jgi:hypothetical protein
MLDKYIEELVKQSHVRERLDSHLDAMVKRASAEAELEGYLKQASVAELAKLAGITLPEDICGGCGGQMEKLGSTLLCQCGLRKKAGLVDMAAFRAAVPARQMIGRSFARGGAAQTVAQKAAPLLMGTGGGALTAKELAAAQGPLQRVATRMGALKSKLVPQAAPQLTPKFASARLYKSAIEKCSSCGKEKSGDMNKGCSCGVEKSAFNPMPAVKSFGTKALSVAKAAPGAVAGKAKQVRGTYQAARRGGLFTPPKGVGGALLETAKAHPGVAAGAAGLGTGYMMGKSGSARLFEIGDAAGRIMAKTAMGQLGHNLTGAPLLTPEEVQEAVQGAQAREDIEGRGQSWGRMGGAIGALGGGALGSGAGYGLGRLLGKSTPMAAGIGGLAGALGGGLYGHRVGQAEGQEEAAADKLVALLRARNAFGAGMGQGYALGAGGDEENPQ